jgi:hypothetical protein
MPKGRTNWIVDAHAYGRRFIVRSDEIMTAFVGLKTAAQANPTDSMNTGYFWCCWLVGQFVILCKA